MSAHKKLCESVKKCRKTHFIWDTNIFYSFVKEIKYFAVLKLITDDDVLHLKTELYQLLAMSLIRLRMFVITVRIKSFATKISIFTVRNSLMQL